jgi:adenylate cyclase
MRWRWLAAAPLRDRIVVFVTVLLLAVLAASFYLIGYAIEDTARDTLRQELRVGARVFQRQFEQSLERQADATAVLTSDYGFREAVATRERTTILSVLANHSARINASGMAVVALDGKVVSDTMAPEAFDRPYAHRDLVEFAATRGRASGVRVIEGTGYQVSVVPVLAPLPIAWVALTYTIDNAVARDLRQLTSSEVTFLEMGEPPRVLASTLGEHRLRSMLREARAIASSGREGATVAIADEDFEVLALPVDRSGARPVFAVLQRSVAEGLQPYEALKVLLSILAALALAVTLYGVARIARSITRPVAELVSAAREIERGNYGISVAGAGSLEIEELSRAFNGMTRGLAERDTMRDVLGKVASPEIANQLLTGEIALGGEERDATVLFTDIRNFTTLAERLTPTETLALLNEFLTVISAVIERHGGVVDKYLGDGVMAIFGAPVRLANDAQSAIEAAIAIRDEVRTLGRSLAERGLPNPDVGVGVNTSRVIAGNVGSPTRLNYTVLGDGVNLASRLEGLTKRYQVAIVTSERTREGVSGIAFRELDKVRVRGRSQAVRVFEPLAREEALGAEERTRLANWHAALEDFRERHWERSGERFDSLAAAPGYARLAEIYRGYLAGHQANPPGDDWDGAFTLYEK